MQVTLFIISGLVGLLGGFVLSKADADSWRNRRVFIWTRVATALLISVLFSFIAGAELLAAAGVFLVCAVYLSFKHDPEFSTTKAQEALLVTTLLAAAVGDIFWQLIKKVSSPNPAEPPKSTRRPLATRADFSQKSPAPQKQDAAPAAPKAAFVSGTGMSEQEVLQKLLLEIGRLQKWTARPEAERATLVQLSSDVKKTETALNEAVLQLKNGTVDWRQICEHVEGLKQHQLPDELSKSLDALVAERAGKVEDTRKTVGEVSAKLRDTTGELKQQLEKPVLSPEELIDSANTALRAADELSAAKR